MANVPKQSIAKHSVVIISSDEEHVTAQTETILSYCRSGIKVLLFSNCSDGSISIFKPFSEAGLFNHFPLSKRFLKSGESPTVIIDGMFESTTAKKLLEKLGVECTDFNYEQYLVEHAGVDKHLAIEASAGTGKTTVMIQRILFLLHMNPKLKLREIVMITFTRAATQHMRDKLRKTLLKRYEVTRNIKYLHYLEDISGMRISTIPSFGKYLLQHLGSAVGYGQNVSIRSFKQERKEIIEKILDEIVKTWKPNEKIKDILTMELYKFTDLMDEFWTEMENKGLILSDFEDLNWGLPEKDSDRLHEIIQRVFTECEERLQNMKQNVNAVSLSDLIRQLELSQNNGADLNHLAEPIRFLFVDEFQDTDNTQIKLISWIQQVLKPNLFVVGDVKQSIYRFRGAQYTAFDRLKEELKSHGVTFLEELPKLKKNYRTLDILLDEMHPFFTRWGTKEYLQYLPQDALAGVNPQPYPEHWKLEEVKLDLNDQAGEREYASQCAELLDQAQSTLDDDSKERVVALVRTNRQARMLHSWCKEKKVLTHLEVEGDFFTTNTVKDFYQLIFALLHPDHPLAILQLVSTPYSKQQISWTALVKAEGDQHKLLKLLGQHPQAEEWKKYRELVRIEPLFSALRIIIKNTKPTARYFRIQKQLLEEELVGKSPEEIERVAEVRAKQYDRNLNFLMELLHESFSDDFVSLHSVYQWLKIRMATDRDTDQPLLDDSDLAGFVRIMTVHKSKGLEFHTVILPFTDRSFRFSQNEILLEQQPDDTWKVGWKVKKGYKKQLKNSNYAELNSQEDIEVIREETRLLYVAMTRSEKRLWVLCNDAKPSYGSKRWTDLFKLGRGKK